MKKNYFIFLIFTFQFLVSNLFSGVGTTTAQFLKIVPSARAAAMAGSFAAISDDVYSIHFNPSGLSELQKTQVAFTYLKYFADVNYGFLGYATPNTKFGSIGFGLTYLIVDNIEARTAIEQSSGFNEPERYFNAKDQSFIFSYAKRNSFPNLLEGVNLGGNLRLIQSEIDQVVGYTLSLDLAAMYSPLEKIKTALVIQNISFGMKFREETDLLPLDIKFAFLYKPIEKLNLVCDIDEYIIDTKFYVSFGVEYWVIKNLALRSGYRFGYDSESLGKIAGFSCGLGFCIWNINLDYAFVPFGILGDTHRVSIIIKL